MTRIFRSLRNTVALVALASMSLFTAHAQEAAGKVHGHIVNAIGSPVSTGEVKLTEDRESDASKRKFTYTFPVDANGDFKGDNVKPGDYLLVYFDKNLSVDFVDHVIVKANEDTAQNVDMTREEYQKTLTPEQKKEYEEIKKKNAGAMANNAKVSNVNALLNKAREEMKNKDFATAETDMKQATDVKGDEPIVWNAYGDALYGNKKYAEAITAYQKSLDLNAASKKPTKDIEAADYSQMGLAQAMSGKPTDAMQSFEKAAAAEPAKAGSYYYNAAAVLYNAGKTDEAGAAVDKAIAADPNKAESYYIKGQTLIGKSTVVNNKIVPPPGTVEAYSKYLELDPNGKHAADVKGIIAGFDETVVNNYKASRNRKK